MLISWGIVERKLLSVACTVQAIMLCFPGGAAALPQALTHSWSLGAAQRCQGWAPVSCPAVFYQLGVGDCKSGVGVFNNVYKGRPLHGVTQSLCPCKAGAWPVVAFVLLQLQVVWPTPWEAVEQAGALGIEMWEEAQWGCAGCSRANRAYVFRIGPILQGEQGGKCSHLAERAAIFRLKCRPKGREGEMENFDPACYKALSIKNNPLP